MPKRPRLSTTGGGGGQITTTTGGGRPAAAPARPMARRQRSPRLPRILPPAEPGTKSCDARSPAASQWTTARRWQRAPQGPAKTRHERSPFARQRSPPRAPASVRQPSRRTLWRRTSGQACAKRRPEAPPPREQASAINGTNSMSWSRTRTNCQGEGAIDRGESRIQRETNRTNT